MENNIINKLRKKDERTQEYFYKTYGKSMFIICYRYVNNEDEAAAIVNEGFYKVFSRIAQFRDGGLSGLLAWTRKIMINECLKYIRQQSPHHFLDLADHHPEIPVIKPQANPDAEVYYQMIRQLPFQYRTVFNLYALEGYSHKEIAQWLDISENTSRSHLLRAREVLKEQIQKVIDYER